MTLGQRIQELRRAHDLSQEALGEKLGVSRQAVSRWEMDGAVPEVDKLIAMGRLFGVDLNSLLQVDQPEPAGETPDTSSAEDSPLHPSNWWKWLPPTLSLLALVLGLVALTISFGRTVGTLNDRLTELEARIDAIESGTETSLTTIFDFSFGTGTEKYQMEVWLLPRVDSEQLEQITFQTIRQGDGFTKTSPAQRQENGLYSATLYLQDMEPGFQLAAVFSYGEGQASQTQALMDVQEFYYDRDGLRHTSWQSLWNQN